MGGPNSGKMRKKGDWEAVARGRSHKERDLVRGRGVSNVPSIQDVGSAAYRRLLGKAKK